MAIVDSTGRLITSKATKGELTDVELMEVADRAWEQAKSDIARVPLQEILDEMYHEYLSVVNVGMYPVGFTFEKYLKDGETTIVSRLDRIKSMHVDRGIPSETFLDGIADEMQLAPGIHQTPEAEDREFQEYALRRALEAIRAYRAGAIDVKDLPIAPIGLSSSSRIGNKLIV